MSNQDAYRVAQEVCQMIIAAGPHVVDWNHDINKVLPELETVRDESSICGYRTSWDGRLVRFVFSTFYRYSYVREAVVRAGLDIEKDNPSEESGVFYRHSILIRVPERLLSSNP